MYDYKLYQLSPSGVPVPALGSDSVGYIDKRLSAANQHSYLVVRAKMLNEQLGKCFIGYALTGSSNLYLLEQQK